MRLILFMLLATTSLLYAKTFGVVIVESKHFTVNQTLPANLKELFDTQMQYYILPEKHSIKVILDKNNHIKTLYSHSGTQALVEYAKQKRFDSLAIVEYKKGSKFLSFTVLVNDSKVQDKKTQLIAYKPQDSDILAKTILNSVLSLNYQLGVFNVASRY